MTMPWWHTFSRDALAPMTKQELEEGLCRLLEHHENWIRNARDENAALKKGLRAQESMTTWQPMLTAPRDGTPILVFVEGAIFEVRFETGRRYGKKYAGWKLILHDKWLLSSASAWLPKHEPPNFSA